MRNSSEGTDAGFMGRWVLATGWGWIVGVLLLLAIAALGERLHLEGQWPVGMGMGLGVGFAQWRVARRWFGADASWLWATVAGLTLPFIAADLLSVPFDRGDNTLLIVALVVCGSLLIGVWQAQLVRATSAHRAWWVAICVLSWTATSLLVLAGVGRGGHPATAIAAIRNIGAVALGGVVLGALQGAGITWLRSAERSSVSPVF